MFGLGESKPGSSPGHQDVLTIYAVPDRSIDAEQGFV